MRFLIHLNSGNNNVKRPTSMQTIILAHAAVRLAAAWTLAFRSRFDRRILNMRMSHALTAITNFLDQQAHRITHIAVAHTRYKTYERTASGMQRIVELAKQDCKHFRNCLNKELYGRRASRRPLLYQPLLIATLEGSLINTNRDLTLHYNFAFGNLPEGLAEAEFQAKFYRCWVEQAHQRNNIWHDSIGGDVAKARGWLGYSMKEAQTKGNTAVWDFENTQIPYAALNAG